MLWIVDDATDTVYTYGSGKTLISGTGTITGSFKLGSGNLAPQGIADPMAGTVAAKGAGAVPDPR